DQGLTSKELLERLRAAGLDVKAPASTVDEADALRALGANGSGPNGDRTSSTAGPPKGDSKKPRAAQRPAPAPGVAPATPGAPTPAPPSSAPAAGASPAQAPGPPPAPRPSGDGEGRCRVPVGPRG